MTDHAKDDGLRLGDVLQKAGGPVPIYVTHEQPSCVIALETLGELTDTGREDFSQLLNARVKESRAGEDGVEIVVDGVDPAELERFRAAYEAHEQAERAMGPVM